MRAILLATTALSLAACAVDPPETLFVDLSSPPVEAVAPVPAPVQVVEEHVKPRKHKNRRTSPGQPIDAVTVFPYEENRIYQITAHPGYITSIQLEPGEIMPGKAAIGNPEPTDWIVEKTTAGGPAGARVIVLIKPGRPGIGTNLVLATNRRVYQLDVTSVKRRAMDIVRWSYPSGPPVAAPIVVTGAAFDPEMFSRAYTIEMVSGEQPRWYPVGAFYTGSKSYIEFPAGIGAISAPALFSISGNGAAVPVPFRARGRFYEIDTMIAAAELRQGDVVVRIRSGGNG